MNFLQKTLRRLSKSFTRKKRPKKRNKTIKGGKK